MIELDLQPVPNPAPKKQTFIARFKPNTPIYILIGVVIITAVTGSVLSPDRAMNILGFCGIIATSLFGMAKQNDAATQAAERAQEVAVNLEERGERTEKQLTVIQETGVATKETGDKVHTLVNSNMGVQLRLTYAALARVAVLTKDPEDTKAAELAKELLHEHEKKQAVVDEKEEKEKPTSAASPVSPEDKAHFDFRDKEP